jgi:lipopolysaccharide heptosyltransferase II
MDTANKDYDLFLSEANIARAGQILKKVGIGVNEKFFVINPGGNWLPKRWPKGRYAELCKHLKDEMKTKIVITGAEKDMPLADEIIKISNGSAVSICGRTTLKESAAVMRVAALVISNDSGPMHIAISQKTPTIALFGPTSPHITGPYGNSDYEILHKWLDCEVPCYVSCEKYRCMEAISVDDVMDAIRRLIKRQTQK